MNNGRNNDMYDKSFRATDNASLRSFLHDVQPFDDRIEMMELWLARKEQEFKSRVNYNMPEMRLSD